MHLGQEAPHLKFDFSTLVAGSCLSVLLAFALGAMAYEFWRVDLIVARILSLVCWVITGAIVFFLLGTLHDLWVQHLHPKKVRQSIQRLRIIK